MYNPNENDNNVNQGNLNNSTDPYTNPNQVMWQGDYYHTYQNAEQLPQEPKKEKKPLGKGAKLALKITAALMACLVVSGSSVALFAAAINAGYVHMARTLPPPAPESSFTITNLMGNSNPSTLGQGELTLQQIAKKAVPSVVCIQTYTSKMTAQFAQERAVFPTSEGSGIIATKDGYIITNAHVVDEASSLKVILSTGVKYEAKLIGADRVTDLAVIKIDATDLVPAEFGSSANLQVADTVMAIGNPGGVELNSSVTIGYVSALNRQITNSESGYVMSCIQTDAAINPGNSGGALVNMHGQVIGINSSKIGEVGYEGLGFAISIDHAQPVISDLKKYGYVKDRAVLGVTGQFIDSMTAQFYNLPMGMYVTTVTNASVAKAGVTKGCVITKVDDTEVTSTNAITAYISKKKPLDTVTLTGVNSETGKAFVAKVTLTQTTGK